MFSFLKSFHYAFRGIKETWQSERNFKVQTIIGTAVIAISIILRFSYIEISIIIFAAALVLAAEILNTVIETALDAVEPDNDPSVRKIKDMAAGMVLAAAIGALIIGIVIFIHHFTGAEML